jgi:hypothetical protein
MSGSSIYRGGGGDVTITLELTEHQIYLIEESVRENEVRYRAYGHKKANELADLLYIIHLKKWRDA